MEQHTGQKGQTSRNQTFQPISLTSTLKLNCIQQNEADITGPAGFSELAILSTLYDSLGRSSRH